MLRHERTTTATCGRRRCCPFIPVILLHQHPDLAGNGGLAIARAARLHPTFGLWPVTLREPLAQFLAAQAPKVMDFCTLHRAALADFPDETAFANINTPDDLAALQAAR